jgi:hypothetical protein
LGITLLLITFGCSEDILDKKPLDQFSDADFWKDPNLTSIAINQLYVYLSPDDGFHEWESYTNNAIDGILWAPSHSQLLKGWTASDANSNTRYWTTNFDIHGGWLVSSLWKVGYREIRDCNIAIKNLTATENKSERLNQFLAEAKFMRAYQYHLLTAQIGAVILVDHPLGLNDEVNLPRNTYKECVDFMVKDLDEAAAVLPISWDATNRGRVTSGTALALKGRIQLYAERWADAAATYKSVIDAGTYSLYPNFQTLFFEENENNQEVILDVQYLYPEFVFSGNAQALSVTQNGWAAANPTQNLVDQFELLDGKAWNDPTSIYYDASNPYANRDNRFYGTVQFDQGIYFGKRLETGSGIDGNANLVKGADVESFTATQTGYYLCKGIDTRGTQKYDAYTPVPAMGTNVILMRYAEVLLGYAEAKNEATGPDQSVYTAINTVRSRAGLPDLPGGLSKEQMRAKIRKERRTELCFEHIYYFDCLRWKDQTNFTEIPKVVNITYTYDLNADGSVKIDNTNRKVVLSRTFAYSNYPEGRNFNLDTDFGWFFPIPQEEIDKNPNIVQNGAFEGNIKQ